MCNTHNVQLPHKLLHGHDVRTKQSRVSVPKNLQSRALKDKLVACRCVPANAMPVQSACAEKGTWSEIAAAARGSVE